MTREERVVHGKRICRKITGKINEFSPPGLGHWPRCWNLVSGASDAFLDALNAWIEEDTPEARLAVQEAGDALLWAWEGAGDLYRILEGSPSREVGRARV